MTHQAGQPGTSPPWAGRTLSIGGFDGDTGEADPELLATLATHASSAGADNDVVLMRRVAVARLIVAIVPAPGDVESVDGLPAERSADMAVVTLTGPDGRRALPVFTSTASLAAWDPAARPVPVTAARAAQAAVSEQCDVLVVDVGTPDGAELRTSMVWALAQAREWLPAHADPFVAAAVDRAIASEPAVTSHRVEEGEPPGAGVLRIVLLLVPGLDATEVEALVTRVGELLATDGELRARVDGLSFAVASDAQGGS
ncbi:MAG: SseB family protein [Actinomycetota bacterium]|nr:SseB family protein [Actinomycetota bacterium]